jgi:hypothetical protein
MYGDTEVMRRHAGRLREQGEDIRTLADSLVGQVESLRWTGRAAEALRERVRERAVRLREVAARHETAAESLEAHGHEVEELKDAIAAVERRAAALHPVPDDGADAERTGFEAPPSGHRDWLGVSLPGL